MSKQNNRNLIALAGALTIGALIAEAQAETYLWTRGSMTSSNWSNSNNWSPQDGGPLPLPQNEPDTDLLYSGTPLSLGNTTINGDYLIRSITIDPSLNLSGGSLSFAAASGVPSAIMTLGSGGIAHNNDAFQMKFTFQGGLLPEQQKIIIGAPQTWHNKLSATNSGTLSVDRPLEGAAANTITKTGPGLLILTRDNSAFLGGFNINEGTIRLANNSNAFGAGTLSALQAGTVGITASTDLPQTIAGQLNFGGGGQINFGGSFPFTWNGQVNMLSTKSISNSATVSITANGAFTGPGRYIKVGGGTLTLNAPSNSHGGFDVRSGFIAFDSDAKLGAPGAALGLGATGVGTVGVAIMTAPVNSPTRPLSLLADADLGVLDIGSNNVTFGAASGGGGLRKVGTGVLTLANVRADGQLAVDAGNVVIAANGTDAGASRIGTLALAAGSSLDLKDNDLVLVNDSYASTTAKIAAARNGGSWNGVGITSSTAASANPKNRTLGTLTGTQFLSLGQTTFDGFTVAGTDTLVKFTWYGDTDFNGVVDFDDYSRTDNGFNNAGSTWFQGDFDYNGLVNFDDYSLIDNAFNTQSGTLRQAIAYLDGSDRDDSKMTGAALELVVEHYAQFGQPYAQGFLNAVPEPTAVGLFSGLAALAAGARVRRNKTQGQDVH